MFSKSLCLANTASEFYIEEELVSKVYKEVTQSAALKRSSYVSIVPMLGFLKPKHLLLANKYFKTDYNQFNSLPLLYLVLQGRLPFFKNSPWFWNTSIGYGYLQGNVIIQDTFGMPLADTISLQWLPFEITSKYQLYDVLPVGLLSLEFGGGRLWLHQDGNLDGFDQGFFFLT